ncbi:MAG: hydrogenase small subunit, partial [Gammaproteobacteria bacterium]
LKRQGISRRSFLKFCTLVASSMALPLSAVSQIAEVIGESPRPRVIWLSGQECTGCSESLLRAYDIKDSEEKLVNVSLETMILNFVSLDYHNTLMAPSGTAAELSRYPEPGSAEADIPLVVVIDGSIPLAQDGALSCIGGRSVIDVVYEAVGKAALVVAVGNCASFGGLPKAKPNPTGARSVEELMASGDLPNTAPLINVPGCPPVPEVMAGVLFNFILSGFQVPDLDHLKRPKAYYEHTVHSDCSRLAHYNSGQFATSFDGDEAQQGYCLMKLGCKGTLTFNACTTTKWNNSTSYPMFSGHGCLGCSEPDFWDQWDKYESFYTPVV